MAEVQTVRLKKRIERRAGGLALRLLGGLVRLLPEKAADRLGAFFGRVFFALGRRRRKTALVNLRMCFPDWTEDRIRSTARRVFEHFGRTSTRFLRSSRVSEEDVVASVSATGLEHLDAALKKGCGVILITAHFGNWERLAHFLAAKGYKVSVVARDTNDPKATEMVNEVRRSEGLDVFSRGSAAREMLRRLGNNECVGILPDQNAWGEIFVPFFGIPAGTAAGPAVIHLRTGAPIIGIFCAEVEGGYELVAAPIDLPEPTGNRDEDVRLVTLRINEAMEAAIRLHPEQWLWMHDRWRSARAEGLLD